jgi:hypothetical protein
MCGAEIRLQSVRPTSKQGMKEGAQTEKIAIASQLLDILDDATIAAKTGLTAEAVAALRDG